MVPLFAFLVIVAGAVSVWKIATRHPSIVMTDHSGSFPTSIPLPKLGSPSIAQEQPPQGILSFYSSHADNLDNTSVTSYLHYLQTNGWTQACTVDDVLATNDSGFSKGQSVLVHVLSDSRLRYTLAVAHSGATLVVIGATDNVVSASQACKVPNTILY